MADDRCLIASLATDRLRAFGLTYPDYTPDRWDNLKIDMLSTRLVAEVLDNINCTELPDGLREVVVDMVAAQFLKEKLVSGELDGFVLTENAESITEGDITVKFATSGGSSGGGSRQTQFAAMLDRLIKPHDSVFAAYRRMRW